MTATRSAPRTIAVLTTGRQDWGILHSIGEAIQARPASSSASWSVEHHLSDRYGRRSTRSARTVSNPTWSSTGSMGRDPVPPRRRRRRSRPSGNSCARLRPMRYCSRATASRRSRRPWPRPSRASRSSMSMAASRHTVPSMTRCVTRSPSSATCTSRQRAHGGRVLAMGEDRPRPTSSGRRVSTGLPHGPAGPAELEASLGLDLAPPVVIVTVHPATLDVEAAAAARS